MIFFEKLKEYDIILASKSPRRQELLKESLIPFRVVQPDFSESIEEQSIIKPEQIVLELCQSKAKSCTHLLDNEKTFIIAADTIVFFKGQLLNKPNSKTEAKQMLQKLSDSAHDVYTGVCIKASSINKTFYEKTRVFFRKLDDYEIDYYVEKCNPLDKAGGYGIQDWIGLIGVEKIDGSYDNVVGLPVSRLILELIDVIR